MMIQVNALGDACPIPVVKTKNAIRSLGGSGVVKTLVDNEIAVQNLTKMANQKGYGVASRQLSPREYLVTMTIGEGASLPAESEETFCDVPSPGKKNTLVVIRSAQMGVGSEELGTALMKSFFYALGQQEELPSAILFYNGGASIPCGDTPILDDLRSMQERGVEILTCGTCLNFYGLSDQLKIGEVTNMYTIVEKMTQADRIVNP